MRSVVVRGLLDRERGVADGAVADVAYPTRPHTPSSCDHTAPTSIPGVWAARIAVDPGVKEADPGGGPGASVIAAGE